MSEEIEIGWLQLTDNSDLVLTTRHVCQRWDQGLFGESRLTLPRNAITSVRISWQRSWALVVMGTILLVAFLFLMITSFIPGSLGISRGEEILNISSSRLALIKYGSLVAGMGIFLLFAFYKKNKIEIAAPSAVLAGIPRSYDEAEHFCSLLTGELKEPPQTADRDESKTENKSKATDHDWRL